MQGEFTISFFGGGPFFSSLAGAASPAGAAAAALAAPTVLVTTKHKRTKVRSLNDKRTNNISQTRISAVDKAVVGDAGQLSHLVAYKIAAISERPCHRSDRYEIGVHNSQNPKNKPNTRF